MNGASASATPSALAVDGGHRSSFLGQRELAGRRGSRRRSRPGSTPGRSATSGRRSRRTRAARTRAVAARNALVPAAAASRRSAGPNDEPVDDPQRGVLAGDLVDRLDRGQEAAGEDVLVDPGVGAPRVASIRSCGMVIAWMPTRPPGASSRSRVLKYVGQYSWPTASIISTETIASKLPVTWR